MNLDFDNKKMKYKTLYYDVTSISHRLPDDCLRIIAKYAYDESRYKYLERIPKVNYRIYMNCVKITVKLRITLCKHYEIETHVYMSGGYSDYVRICEVHRVQEYVYIKNMKKYVCL